MPLAIWTSLNFSQAFYCKAGNARAFAAFRNKVYEKFRLAVDVLEIY